MNFENMPDHSRVWVYQADRFLSEEEQSTIHRLADIFIQEWAAHGSKLGASYCIRHGLFFILAVDEETAAASGCSIDASVAFIKKLEDTLNVGFMDRLKIAFRDAENTIQVLGMEEFKTLIRLSQINENTVVFNNLVQNIGELNSKWEVPAKESWHSQLFELVK